MLRLLLISAGCCGIFSTLIAQQTAQNHPIDTLETVVVKVFEQNRKLIDVGAAVVVVGKSTLHRFQNFSLEDFKKCNATAYKHSFISEQEKARAWKI